MHVIEKFSSNSGGGEKSTYIKIHTLLLSKGTKEAEMERKIVAKPIVSHSNVVKYEKKYTSSTSIV